VVFPFLLFTLTLYHIYPESQEKILHKLDVIRLNKIPEKIGATMGANSLTPNQLTLLARPPAVNTLLIHSLTDYQSVFLQVNTLANIDIVDAFAQPDADIAVATQAAMQQRADFLGSFAGNSGNTDLPASFIFHNFAVAQSQTLAFFDIPNGADIDSTVGSILHNFSFLVFGIFLSLSDYILSHPTEKSKNFFRPI
jgi:hypothetical protein